MTEPQPPRRVGDAARRARPARKERSLVPYGLALAVVPVALLVVYVATRSSTSSERPPPPSPPVSSAPPPPPPPAKSAEPDPGKLARAISEVEALQREGKLLEAMERARALDPRDGPDPQAAENRILALVEALERAAWDLQERRVSEAEELVDRDRYRDAVDRIAELDRLRMRPLLEKAYDRLRAAVGARLQARRRKADEETRRAMAAAVERTRGAPAPKNAQDLWKRAQALLQEQRWAEAIEALTPLAAVPELRSAALAGRARAHFATERFAELLADLELLDAAGRAPDEVVEHVNRSLLRAPIDETARRIFEQSLARDPQQPAMWRGLSFIHQWRGDTDAARATFDLAVDRKAGLDAGARTEMTLFLRRERNIREVFQEIACVEYAGPYEILTDAGPQEARRLADRLQAIADNHGRVFPFSRNPHLLFSVVFFSTWRDYDRYSRSIGSRTEHALAYYAPDIKRLVVHGDPKHQPTPEDVVETLRHEAFHQFLDCYADRPPAWFNEGGATYVEKSTPDRPVMDVEEHLVARLSLTKPPPLRELLMMDLKEWQRDPKRMLELYAKGWSLTYWLHASGRAGLWRDYLGALVLGADAQEAFDRVFAKDFDALERGWRRAVESGQYGR